MCESGLYDVKTFQAAVDNACSFEIHQHGSRNTIYMPGTGQCKDRETMSSLISTILNYFYILIFLAEIFWLQL